MLGPERIQSGLFADVPTPLDESGSLHGEGLRMLVEFVKRTGLAGVAVGSLLDRGARLDAGITARLLTGWREGLGPDRILIASLGLSPSIRRPQEIFEAARTEARRAAEVGADLLLVQPPVSLRAQPERDRLVLEHHSVAAEMGLPLLVSYRRESSGGIAYGPEVLAQLLARPEVLGVEIATIDGITIFQQVAALVRQIAPEKRVVSGEERFLGYSLMCGADSAIVGMASAFPETVLELMKAHVSADAFRFLKLTTQVDALARSIFTPPIEGSVFRLLRTLVQRGVIPLEAAHDPWA